MTNQFEPQPLIVFDNELANQLGDFAAKLERSADAVDRVESEFGDFANRLRSLAEAVPTASGLLAEARTMTSSLERAQAVIENIFETEGIWAPYQDITDVMWPPYGMSLVEEQRVRDHFLHP